MELTQIKNDINGNPRFVVHFLNLLTKEENGYFDEAKQLYIEPILSLNQKYSAALKRAKKIGGRKFHNKQYGGGILFECPSPETLKIRIETLVNSL